MASKILTQPNICTVKNCLKPVHGYSYCSTHYRRYKKFGDPNMKLRQVDPVTRFHRYYKIDPITECWVFFINPDKDGYGRIEIGGRKLKRAHRFSWELFNGQIPDGMLVCHKCDNPPCVNPSHLFLGTPQSNMTDKVNKGRQYRGDRHWTKKLKTGAK